MLGVIIGVSCVIAMMAVGQGARDSVRNQVASLGANVIMVFSGAKMQGGVRMEAGTSKPLQEEDVRMMKETIPLLRYVSPVVRTGAQVVAFGQNWRTSIFGVYPEYAMIKEMLITHGTFFTETDLRGTAKVCLLGNTVAENIFGAGINPVGQVIRVDKLPFKVIGVLAPKGQGTWGQDQDDLIIAPFATVQKKMLATPFVHQIIASALSENVVAPATEEIIQLMRQRHRLGAGDEDDFNVRTQMEIASTTASITRTLSILLASIASISLVVGGIGIMNIMLVSVTERTREIGIRMAVGARGKDVLLQFLVEALVLSFAGGMIGITLGVTTARLISRTQGWAVTIAPEAILLAFFFATATGIFFGWYPAKKAADLNPIDALRYE